MIRYGILGAGGMGGTHARHLSRVDGVSLLVFDQDTAKAADLADKHGAALCSSVEDLLSKSDVIGICLPNDLHMEFGLKAIAAGRGVFMEKPIAQSIESARVLVQAVEKAGVPFMPGHVVRFFPEYAAANNDVKDGVVGIPAVARTRRGGGPPGRGVKDTWFMDHSRSGGILVDLAVHDFDWLRWTLGEVDKVFANSLSATRPVGPDYALAILQFDSGAIAHVEATWMDPGGFRTAFEVCGSKGMLEHDSTRAQPLRARLPGGITGENNLAPDDDPFFKELSSFVRAVAGNTPPPVSARDGFMALSIAASAAESAKTGKWVKPPRC